MTGHLQKPSIIKLVLIFCFANVIGVLMSAALPKIANVYNITKSDSQDVISIYLLGCCLAQILYAPLMKVLGKKASLWIGAGLAILGSIICLISTFLVTFNGLLIGRLLTALGTGSGPVITVAIVTDYFSHKESRKIFSLLMSGFSLIPALGVFIGGLVTSLFSWQACFIVMLLYAVMIGVLTKSIYEITPEADFGHFHPLSILKGFKRELWNVSFTLFMLLSACASSAMFVFASEAPFLSSKYLQMSPSVYGVCNLIPNFCLFLGGIASAYLGHKISLRSTLVWGVSLFTALSLFIGFIFTKGDFSLLTVFFLPAALFLITPFLVSCGRTVANKLSSDKSYAASCLYILTYFSMFSATYSLQFFSGKSVLAMPIVYTGLGVVMLFCYFVGLRYTNIQED